MTKQTGPLPGEIRAVLTSGLIISALSLLASLTGVAASKALWAEALIDLLVFSGIAAAVAAGRGISRVRLGLLAIMVLALVGLNLTASVMTPERSLADTRFLSHASLIVLMAISFPLILALPRERVLENYPHLFQMAWRLTLEAAVVLLLSLVVWGVIMGAASLFASIGVPQLRTLVAMKGSWWAVTPLTLTMGVLAVRQRPAMAAAIQQHVLTLGGWLLPLVGVIAIAFVPAFAIQAAAGRGLGTVPAAGLMALAWFWVVLINAAWQDGVLPFRDGLRRVLRMTVFLLPVLAALGMAGLLIRIGEYGWTPKRIWGFVTGATMLAYGLGYAWGARSDSRFGPMIARTNVVVAIGVSVVVVLLSLPGVNVARLSPLQGESAVRAELEALPQPPITMIGTAPLPDDFWPWLAESNRWRAEWCISETKRPQKSERGGCSMVVMEPAGFEQAAVGMQLGREVMDNRIQLFTKTGGEWRHAGEVDTQWLRNRWPNLLPPKGAATTPAPAPEAKP